ncbi:MAG TPA: RICIN domain-containing protein [Bryobacteraceae bacterium]|nr:RICIN domain-containing protein [Bryobacteraceae bacterium]
MFPANNVWNTRVDTLPVDVNSAAYIQSMNATNPKLHPDFGYGTLETGGMPYNLVPGTQAKLPVSFYYSGDPGGYPIPSNVNIEEGSDHHAILIDTTNCVLYELFNLSAQSSGWQAGSGAIFPLNSNALRPAGETSADAAGLPIFPGLVRYDEVLAGHIDHALRVTADHTRNQYIWPARHFASSLTGTQYPPMGQRFRLKQSFDISSYPAPVQVILQAAKTYGLILADNGTSWHLGGIGDLRWNDTVMHAMTNVTGDNFEAVDETSLMINANSAQAATGPSVPSGWVQVVSENSGKCLDMTGGPAATWQTDPAQQWTCSGSQQTNQQFQFTAVAGGYKITVKNSGLALQPVNGSSSSNGSVIEQWSYDGAPYQLWQVLPTADGHFSIKAASGNYCFDVRAVSKSNGAAVQRWSCTGAANQKWSLVPVN